MGTSSWPADGLAFVSLSIGSRRAVPCLAIPFGDSTIRTAKLWRRGHGRAVSHSGTWPAPVPVPAPAPTIGAAWFANGRLWQARTVRLAPYENDARTRALPPFGALG